MRCRNAGKSKKQSYINIENQHDVRQLLHTSQPLSNVRKQGPDEYVDQSQPPKVPHNRKKEMQQSIKNEKSLAHSLDGREEEGGIQKQGAQEANPVCPSRSCQSGSMGSSQNKVASDNHVDR